MGVVYAAFDPQLNRRIALKLVRTDQAETTARLMREAQALARLSHPNVVTVHDVGTFDGQVFVAMELVAGKSFKTWLGEGPREADVLPALLSAGDGLAAAHVAGIVHRDFKPDNIVVGADGRVRVIDFGLAAEADTSGADPHDHTLPQADLLAKTLTRTGAIMGTPLYMAPEQFLGVATGPHTDQFAFCVTAYETLYGTRPFSGATLLEIAQQVTAGRWKSPDAKTELSRRLSPLITRGLSVLVSERHPSMPALLAAIRSACAENSPVPRAHVPPQASSPARRRWIVAVASFSLMGTIGAAGAFFFFRHDQSTVTVERVAVPDAPASPSVATDAPSIRFARVSYLPMGTSSKETRPLEKLIAKKTGYRLETVSVDDYEQVRDGFRNGKIDIALMSPLNFIRLRRSLPSVVPLAASTADGARTYQGGLVTRMSDSQIGKLEHLKGKSVCWVSSTSVAGYLYPRALLRKNGLDPDSVFRQAIISGDHIAALRALRDETCDVAAVMTSAVYNARDEGMSPGTFRIIATTEEIPLDVMFARADLAVDRRDAIRRALLSISPGSEEGRQLAEGTFTRTDGFVPVTDDDYSRLRQVEDGEAAAQARRRKSP